MILIAEEEEKEERALFLEKNLVQDSQTPYLSIIHMNNFQEVDALLDLDGSVRNDEFQWVVVNYVNLSGRDLLCDFWFYFLEHKKCRSCVVRNKILVKLCYLCCKKGGSVHRSCHWENTRKSNN